MKPDERVNILLDRAKDMVKTRTSNGRQLTITRGPEPVLNPDGDVIGVQVWVDVMVGSLPLDIDPHRVIINPPTHIVTAPAEYDILGWESKPKTTTLDPVQAMWDVLYDSVISHPSPNTKFKERTK